MAFEQLTEREQEVVQQALNSVFHGPYIEDAEFATRLGLDRGQLREVLVAWPRLEDADDDSDASLAINNCMNEVLHGAYISPEDWARQFTVPKEDMEAVYEHWAQLKGYRSIGIL